MKNKIALVLGASGSVGFEILHETLKNEAFVNVVAFVRTSVDHAKLNGCNRLIEKLIPSMTAAALAQAVTDTLAEFPSAEFVGLSALGVGAGTAKLTLAQHRAIDVDLNRAFAEALKKSSRVNFLGLLSAIGANPQAKETGSGAAGMSRYMRVKGEAEEAVKSHGPKTVGIFRPALIRGSVHTPKILDAAAPLFDFFIPKKYHSISTEQIAQAMVAASLKRNSTSEVYMYPEMVELIG